MWFLETFPRGFFMERKNENCVKWFTEWATTSKVVPNYKKIINSEEVIILWDKFCF